jgi:hypothetical protein
MRIALAALVLVAGCGYRAGSYTYPRAAFSGARVTQDCMDLALSRRAAADDEGGIIVQFEIGNRCDHPISIDLLHVHVIGHVRSGRESKLVAFDPDEELVAMPLDGRSYASEAIAYRDPGGDEVAGACVDIATIDHGATPRWVCTGPETPHPPPTPTLLDKMVKDSAAYGGDRECKPGVNDDYVGNRACTVYGAWASPARLPPMFLDWGLRGRSVAIPASDLGTVHDKLAPAMTTDFRFGVNVWHGVYTGLEMELGGAWGASEQLTQLNGVATPPVYVGGSLLLGVRGALGRVSVGAELSAGGRFLQGGGTTTTDGATAASPMLAGEGNVEARVHAEYWLGPWISFGAELGANMLNPNEQLAGGYFSFHTRAFGGDRAHR